MNAIVAGAYRVGKNFASGENLRKFCCLSSADAQLNNLNRSSAGLRFRTVASRASEVIRGATSSHHLLVFKGSRNCSTMKRNVDHASSTRRVGVARKCNFSAIGGLAAISIGSLSMLFPLPGAHGYLSGVHVDVLQGRPGSTMLSLANRAGAVQRHAVLINAGARLAPATASRRMRLHSRQLSMPSGGDESKSMLAVAQIEAMTVPEMKKALKARGLSPTGKASELVERLINECTAQGGAADEANFKNTLVFQNKRGGGAKKDAISRASGAGGMAGAGAGTGAGGATVEAPELDIMDVEDMATLPELQAALRKRGLSDKGQVSRSAFLACR
jgi:hypothetical protein